MPIVRKWRYFIVILLCFGLTLFPHHETNPSQATAAKSSEAIASKTSSRQISQAKQTTDESLKKKIDQILSDPRLDGVSIGVSVRRAQDGELIYTQNGQLHLHLASNMKLITGVTALNVLGPDYRFNTTIATDGNIKGQVLQGNLYMIGQGDPTLLKEDLDQFAKDLKAKGIQKIKGDLIADESWYDDVRYSQDLNWSDEENYPGAPISALTLSPNDDYDASTVIVEVFPGKEINDPPTVKLTPETDVIEIVNRAKTVAKDADRKITVEREHGTNRMIINGTIPVGANETRVWRTVWDPALYTLDVFHKSLTEQDITFIGKHKQKKGIAPKKLTTLTSKKSITLEELMIPFMKLSNNGHGETLVKEMGRIVYDEGSWDKGLQVMEETLESYDMDKKHFLLRDGSGMSHKNLVTTDALTQLLYTVQSEPWFDIFENAQPVAGESERLVGGTLRFRMTEEPTKGNVKAKTGSLTGVNTLSGYVTSADGEKLIFSILINNQIGSSLTDIQDDIATVLAKHKFNK